MTTPEGQRTGEMKAPIAARPIDYAAESARLTERVKVLEAALDSAPRPEAFVDGRVTAVEYGHWFFERRRSALTQKDGE